MSRRVALRFDAQCRYLGLPVPVGEHRFAAPRRWRFDWAFVPQKVAVEQEGGIWSGGRHTRGAGYAKDLEKYNRAVTLGWRVLRFTPAQINSGEAADQVRHLLAQEQTHGHK